MNRFSEDVLGNSPSGQAGAPQHRARAPSDRCGCGAPGRSMGSPAMAGAPGEALAQLFSSYKHNQVNCKLAVNLPTQKVSLNLRLIGTICCGVFLGPVKRLCTRLRVAHTWSRSSAWLTWLSEAWDDSPVSLQVPSSYLLPSCPSPLPLLHPHMFSVKHLKY